MKFLTVKGAVIQILIFISGRNLNVLPAACYRVVLQTDGASVEPRAHLLHVHLRHDSRGIDDLVLSHVRILNCGSGEIEAFADHVLFGLS